MISLIGKKKNSSGFTFLELLFVTIILTILVSIALPNFKNTYDNLRLNNIAWDIYTFLDYAKNRAVIEQKVFRVNIDKISNVFWTSMQVEGEFVDIKEQALRKREIPLGISIEYTKDAIDFFPDGEIEGEDVILKNQLGKTITLKKNVYGYKIEK